MLFRNGLSMPRTYIIYWGPNVPSAYKVSSKSSNEKKRQIKHKQVKRERSRRITKINDVKEESSSSCRVSGITFCAKMFRVLPFALRIFQSKCKGQMELWLVAQNMKIRRSISCVFMHANSQVRCRLLSRFGRGRFCARNWHDSHLLCACLECLMLIGTANSEFDLYATSVRTLHILPIVVE